MVSRGTSGMWNNMLPSERSMRGLGEAYVPKSSQTPASSAPYVPQSSADNPNAAPKFYTLAEVNDIDLKYRILPESPVRQRDRIEAWGLAPKLPACPANSLTSGTNPAGTYCYTGSAPSFGPPGSFQRYSIPFNIINFKPNQRFQLVSKVDRPTEQQVLHVEYFIRKRSIEIFNRLLGRNLSCFGAIPNPSVNRVAACIPGFTTSLPGLKYNPIQPRGDEIDKAGGYAKWIKRGGFPLIKGVVDGTIAAQDDAGSITVCQSILCRCPNAGPQAENPVSCVKATVLRDGTIAQHPGDKQAYFFTFINLSPTGAITLSLDYDEPSKLERFANAFGKTIDGIFNALCTAAPFAQEQMAASALPKCVHKTTNKPCKQGEKDCTCASPSGATIAQNAVVGAGMSLWCKAWGSQQEKPKVDFPIDNIMPQVEEKPVPWAWIVGGAAVVAGLLYAKNR